MKWIIVVDDDKHVLLAIHRLLSRLEGVSVHQAESPEEALEKARQLLASEKALELLLVTDGNMKPTFSMNGDQLVGEMRALAGPALKGALLLSGRVNEWVAQAETCGYELHGKPIEPALLRERTRALLNIPDAPL